MRVLVVDDERAAREVLVDLVSRLKNVEIAEASCLAEARAQLEQHAFDALLVDLRLSDDPDNRDGLTLVSEARSAAMLSVVISGSSDLAAVRAAMKMGAHSYVLKDELCEELIVPVLQSIEGRRALEKEVAELRSRSNATTLPWLVGSSQAMQDLRVAIQRVAVSDRPVLVTGPTGAGKELVVRAIHALGPNPDAPLLDLNCSAFPETLIESQLFGHEKGSFTGADRKHQGFFAAAGVGTVFLDEIAELRFDLQAKLLRVLETRTFRPIGASASQRFCGRFVAATCVDLDERVADGRFREDLYYRLNVLEIRVPALEDRREDIPMLLSHFARDQPRKMIFTNDVFAAAQQMHWPGNVRQLRNIVDRLAVFAPDGPITSDVFAQFVSTRPARSAIDPVAQFAREVLKTNATDKLRLVEDALIQQALMLTEGNKAAAARLLGVHRKVVERRTDRPSMVARRRNPAQEAAEKE